MVWPPTLVNKVLWSTAMSMYLCIVYGCFTTAELNSCNRNRSTKLKTFTIFPFTENLPGLQLVKCLNLWETTERFFPKWCLSFSIGLSLLDIMSFQVHPCCPTWQDFFLIAEYCSIMYIYTASSWFIQSMDTYVVSTTWLLWRWKWRYLYKVLISFLLDIFSEVGLPAHMVVLFWIF